MSITLDTHLDILKEIVDKQQRLKELQDYKLHHELFDTVFTILKKKDLISYGGYALNALLPKIHKIYKDKTLPDYDCFSSRAKQDAIDIGDYLKSKGYEYVEVKSGVHEGTYKVYAEYQPVADITQVSKALFSYLHKNSIVINDIRICPSEFLMWSLYKELCRPVGSIHRWEKIYTRYLIFFRQFRFRDKNLKLENNKAEYVDLIEKLKNFIKNREYTVIGHFAVSLHLDTPCKILSSLYDIDILSDDIEKTFEELKKEFGSDLTIKRHITNEFSEIASNTVSILYKETRLCKLYQTDSCYSYQKIQTFKVGTIDTVLHFLYGNYMTAMHFNTQQGSLAAAYRKLIVALEYYSQQEDKADPDKRLRVKCTGYEKTLLNVRKEMWGKRAFVYRP